MLVLLATRSYDVKVIFGRDLSWHTAIAYTGRLVSRLTVAYG